MTTRTLKIVVDLAGDARKGLGELNTSLGDIGKLAGGVAFAGIGTLAGGIGLGATAGLQMNNAMEKATARINAFTKDGGKTAEIIDMIRERAAKTPFAFQEMTNATAALLPSAKQAQVGLEDLIEQAEILAASNPEQGLEGAAFALKEAVSGDFTSIIERFNLPRSYINKLKEEGVPALEIVQRAMKDMGLDTDLVSALAETAEGRWSTFKDTLQGIASTITQPIFNAFSGGLGDINKLLIENQPLIESVASNLAGKLTQGIIWLKDVGWPGLKNALDQTKEAWTNIIAFMAPVFNSIRDAIPILREFWQNHLTEIKGALIGIGIVLAGATIVGSVIALAGAIATLASPIGIIIGLGALLGAAWAGNWGGIQEKTAAVIEWFKANVLPTIQNAFTWMKDIGLPALSNAWDVIWSNIQAVVERVTPIISEIIAAFSDALKGDWEAFGGHMRKAWEGVWNNNKETLVAAIDYFKRIDWGGIGRNIIQGIANGIRNANSIITEAARSAAKAAYNAAKGFLGIHSPSALFEHLGQQSDAGLAQGFLKSTKSQEAATIKAGSFASSAVGIEGGGGGITISLTYAPVISTASRLEAETVLAPFLANAIRQYNLGRL